MVSQHAGIVALAFAAVVNGSFGVPLKLARRRFPAMPDTVFQAWWGLGVCVISFLTIPANCGVRDDGQPCYTYAWRGIPAGVSCWAATVCVFVAIRHLGVGLQPSVTAGSFVLFSLGEDLLWLGDEVVNAGLLALACVLIALSAGGIALSRWLGRAPPDECAVGDSDDEEDACEPESTSKRCSASPMLSDAGTGRSQATTVLTNIVAAPERETRALVGFIAAVLVGLFGSLVPFLAKKSPGVPPFTFIGTFGIGFAIATVGGCPLLLRGWECAGVLAPRGEWAVWACAPYGVASGCLWGVGNACINLGLQSGIDFPVASSIYQSSLFVGGLWGILWFREVSGVAAVGIFVLAAAADFAGIIVMAKELK